MSAKYRVSIYDYMNDHCWLGEFEGDSWFNPQGAALERAVKQHFGPEAVFIKDTAVSTPTVDYGVIKGASVRCPKGRVAITVGAVKESV